MPKFIAPTDEEVIACAETGLSMNQTCRKLGLTSINWLTKYLKQPGKEKLHARFIQNGKKRQENYQLCGYSQPTEIYFPHCYTPLPDGYKVIWSEVTEKYLGINKEKNIESPIFSSRFAARNWCFLNAGIEIPRRHAKIYRAGR